MSSGATHPPASAPPALTWGLAHLGSQEMLPMFQRSTLSKHDLALSLPRRSSPGPFPTGLLLPWGGFASEGGSLWGFLPSEMKAPLPRKEAAWPGSSVTPLPLHSLLSLAPGPTLCFRPELPPWESPCPPRSCPLPFPPHSTLPFSSVSKSSTHPSWHSAL